MSQPSQAEAEGTAPKFTPGSILAAALVIGGLYLSREVLVPVVFAILLSFVLAIPVGALQKLGLGRKLPVAIVVFLTFLAIGVVGTVVAGQMTELAGQLPRYQSTIREKLASLKGVAGGGPLDRLLDMGESLSQEMAKGAKPDGLAPAPPAPIPVEVTEPPAGPVKTLTSIVGPALKPLATAGLVIVFTVFMLLQRSDLRNRAIRLAGSRDLQRTTAAMNDAATRLSKFFLAQVLLNAAFGVVIATGLWLVGIPNPILWGILAAISKFIPYFGVLIAAGGPLVLAAAVDPSWTSFLVTAGFFAVSEFLVGQVIEPLVYGHSTGLSPVAVILSVTFWTWLWGPVGLILATPLTVCLVVLGRHVEQLRFLDVMLGDRPPLTFPESFYQRALAGDAAEAIDKADEFLKDHRLATFYDEVALGSLALAQADLARGALDERQLDRVAATMTQMIEDLGEHEDPDEPAAEWSAGLARTDGHDPDGDLQAKLHQANREASLLARIEPADLGGWGGDEPVLCIGSRTELDRIAAEMLAQLLGKHGIGARVESAHALTAAGAERLDRPQTRIACLSSLDPGAPVYLRYAVRRLRRRLPGARIVVGIWGIDAASLETMKEATHADFCAVRLVEAAGFCLAEAGRHASPATAQDGLAVLAAPHAAAGA